MRQEYESAVAQAVAIAPNCADGYGLLALIKNALGEADLAIALIEKGMRLNPYFTWDYPNNLGRAYDTLGRIDEAVTALEDARSRRTGIPTAIRRSVVGGGKIRGTLALPAPEIDGTPDRSFCSLNR